MPCFYADIWSALQRKFKFTYTLVKLSCLVSDGSKSIFRRGQKMVYSVSSCKMDHIMELFSKQITNHRLALGNPSKKNSTLGCSRYCVVNKRTTSDNKFIFNFWWKCIICTLNYKEGENKQDFHQQTVNVATDNRQLSPHPGCLMCALQEAGEGLVGCHPRLAPSWRLPASELYKGAEERTPSSSRHSLWIQQYSSEVRHLIIQYCFLKMWNVNGIWHLVDMSKFDLWSAIKVNIINQVAVNSVVVFNYSYSEIHETVDFPCTSGACLNLESLQNYIWRVKAHKW